MKKLWKEILATFVLFIGEAHSQNSINTGVTSSLPESCFKYLKEVLGRDDVASEKYSLKIKEAGSFEHKGKKIPIFGLRAYDLPKNRPFKILNRNAIGCTYKIFEGFVSKDNKLIHGGDSVPFLSIYLGGFAVGEPTQFLLVDKETGTTDSVNYLPYSMTPKITKSFKVTPYYISAKPPGYFFDLYG